MSKRQWQSFGLALGLESLVLAGLLVWSLNAHVSQQAPLVPLLIELIEKPKSIPATQPEPVKPKVQTSARTLPAKPEAITPSPAQAVTHEVHVPAARPEIAPPQTTAYVAPPPPTGVDPTLAYNLKLNAAVQAAFEVPGSAKALSFKGKARVEFNLRDGIPSAVRVIQSSGLGAVDRAAVQAVHAAAFPFPPASLQGKELTYQIWVSCF